MDCRIAMSEKSLTRARTKGEFRTPETQPAWNAFPSSGTDSTASGRRTQALFSRGNREQLTHGGQRGLIFDALLEPFQVKTSCGEVEALIHLHISFYSRNKTKEPRPGLNKTKEPRPGLTKTKEP